MNISKLYHLSVVLNLMPSFIMFVIKFIKVGANWGEYSGDNNLFFGYSKVLFMLSILLNLSFFLMKINYVWNNKVLRFFAGYLSSIFFFINSTIMVIFLSGFIGSATITIYAVFWAGLFFYFYFFVNFLLVFFFKRRYYRAVQKTP